MKLECKLNSFAQEDGFTLIEMLIVVAIIGILVAIAVPALNTAKSDAVTAKRNATLSAIALAKDRFVLDPLTTAAHITAYNALDDQDTEMVVLAPYMLVNGKSPSFDDILKGTGAKRANVAVSGVDMIFGINDIDEAPVFLLMP